MKESSGSIVSARVIVVAAGGSTPLGRALRVVAQAADSAAVADSVVDDSVVVEAVDFVDGGNEDKSLERRHTCYFRPAVACAGSRNVRPYRKIHFVPINQIGRGESEMKWKMNALAVIAVCSVAGCATQEDFLNSRQDVALQTAVNRARFDMSCPEASGQVLSREVTQPAIQGPRMMGEERGLFTIGVEGCGRKETYDVVCPMGGDGCTSVEGRRPLMR